MNCDLVVRLLDDYFEDGLNQRDRYLVEKHLARCPRCAGEQRRRPAFDRQVRQALTDSVRPLVLSSDASTRIVQSAEASLHRAVRAHRTHLAFRLVGGAVAIALLLVGVFSLMGRIPGPLRFPLVSLLPENKLILSDSRSATLTTGDRPAPRHTVTSATSLPVASFLMDPRNMRPNDPFTMTVVLHSDLSQSLESVRLNLDVTGPTGYYHFGLAVQGPLPAQGVSIFRVTPEVLAKPCQEQYLIAPTDVFSLPGVYTVRVTVFDPVVASAQ